MEIIKKQTEEVEVSTLHYGDVFRLTSERIFMVIDGTPYIEDDGSVFKVVIVDLEKGKIDRIRPEGRVRPIKLVAREQ